MKNLINPIIAIILLLFLISCNSSNNSINEKSKKLYFINIDGKETFFDWAKLIKIEKIIPLETNSLSAIGYLYKGNVQNGNIILLDRTNSNLLVFDTTGKFLRKIGEKGRAPGNYISLRDFIILDTMVYILDYNKIQLYSLIDGKHILSIDIETNKTNAGNFILFDDQNYYLWDSDADFSTQNNAGYRLIRIQNGNLVSSYFKKNHTSLGDNRFFKKDDESYFMKPNDGDNKVYKLTKDSIIVYFELNFTKQNLPEDYFERNEIDDINEYLKSNYFKGISGIFEVGDYIYFTCVGPYGKPYEGLINSKSQQLFFGRFNFKTNPHIFYSDGQNFYGYFNAVTLLKELNEEPNNTFSSIIKNSVKNLKAEDNFVIIKFSLK